MTSKTLVPGEGVLPTRFVSPEQTKALAKVLELTIDEVSQVAGGLGVVAAITNVAATANVAVAALDRAKLAAVCQCVNCCSHAAAKVLPAAAKILSA